MRSETGPYMSKPGIVQLSVLVFPPLSSRKRRKNVTRRKKQSLGPFFPVRLDFKRDLLNLLTPRRNVLQRPDSKMKLTREKL